MTPTGPHSSADIDRARIGSPRGGSRGGGAVGGPDRSRRSPPRSRRGTRSKGSGGLGRAPDQAHEVCGQGQGGQEDRTDDDLAQLEAETPRMSHPLALRGTRLDRRPGAAEDLSSDVTHRFAPFAHRCGLQIHCSSHLGLIESMLHRGSHAGDGSGSEDPAVENLSRVSPGLRQRISIRLRTTRSHNGYAGAIPAEAFERGTRRRILAIPTARPGSGPGAVPREQAEGSLVVMGCPVRRS